MFDYVKSSYPLGEDFSGNCQTKDIEESIGGTMSQYWIDPNGQLYLINYSNTSDFIVLGKGDEGYDDNLPWRNFKWVPNGEHGRVSPVYLTKYVRLYPDGWDGPWEERPEVRINFRNGVIKDLIYNPT